MLTFRQLTLQCCHHSLTQFQSPATQFIQNQAPIHHLNHHLYAHYQNPQKVRTQCFRNYYFFDQPSYFCRSERQNKATGRDRILSLHWKEVRSETSFSLAVFSKTTTLKFAERGPRFAGGGSTTARNKGLIPWYEMCYTVQNCPDLEIWSRLLEQWKQYVPWRFDDPVAQVKLNEQYHHAKFDTDHMIQSDLQCPPTSKC